MSNNSFFVVGDGILGEGKSALKKYLNFRGLVRLTINLQPDLNS